MCFNINWSSYKGLFVCKIYDLIFREKYLKYLKYLKTPDLQKTRRGSPVDRKLSIAEAPPIGKIYPFGKIVVVI